MSTKDAKPPINGAYSIKYRILEKERFERLMFERKDNTKSLKERAHQLSKQTQQRRRALEEKKQAMAKAEEERRKRTLEERKRQQNEAIERFRTALPSRQMKPPNRSAITLEMLYHKQHHLAATTTTSKPGASLANSNTSTATTTTTTASDKLHSKLVLGRDVEVTPIFTPAATTPVSTPGLPNHTQNKTAPPNLDQVLERIRGKIPDKIPSVENILLSPEPATDPATLMDMPHPRDTNDTPINSSSSSSNSSILSLHDSLDSTDLVNDSSGHSDINTVSTPIQTNSLSTSEQSPSMQTNSLSASELPLPSSCSTSPQQRRGILKKANTTSLNGASGKRVRFTQTAKDHTSTISRATNPHRMRVCLTGKGHHHQIISPAIAKLGTSRNDITIHIPPALGHQLVGEVHSPPPINNSNYQNMSDLWTTIGAFVQQQRSNEDLTISTKKQHHQPVRLWKRQQQTSTPPITPHQGDSISTEERRLLESIETINNKLRTLPTATNNEQLLLVRNHAPSPNQSRRIRHPVIKHRTYYHTNNHHY